MRLGLLADIHENVTNLRIALEHFRRERVDRVVVLGDIFQMRRDLDETVELLVEAGAIGVWGNHEFGLAYQPAEDIRQSYAGPVLDFMTSLRPRLVLGPCHFSHVEPWLNPEVLDDIWWGDGLPSTVPRLAQSFSAVPQPYIFLGHFHCWRLAGPDGVIEWNGERPVCMPPDRRFLIIVHGLDDGRYALFDTETGWLKPYTIGS